MIGRIELTARFVLSVSTNQNLILLIKNKNLRPANFFIFVSVADCFEFNISGMLAFPVADTSAETLVVMAGAFRPDSWF